MKWTITLATSPPGIWNGGWQTEKVEVDAPSDADAMRAAQRPDSVIIDCRPKVDQ